MSRALHLVRSSVRALMNGFWELSTQWLVLKSDHIHDLPQGIFAISESALTHAGERKVRRELRSAHPPHTLIAGHPAKSEAKFAIGGKQTGVVFVSTFPCRPTIAGCSSELCSSSRLAAAKFCVEGSRRSMDHWRSGLR